FDYDEMHFLLRYLRPEDNFLDVGANVGVYTILASSVVTRGEIHAFEPSTQSQLRFQENIWISRLSNVHLHLATLYHPSPHHRVYKTRLHTKDATHKKERQKEPHWDLREPRGGRESPSDAAGGRGWLYPLCNGKGGYRGGRAPGNAWRSADAGSP